MRRAKPTIAVLVAGIAAAAAVLPGGVGSGAAAAPAGKERAGAAMIRVWVDNVQKPAVEQITQAWAPPGAWPSRWSSRISGRSETI